MRSLIKTVLFAVIFAGSAASYAQKSKGGGDPEHRDVHRSISSIEAEMLQLIAQNEAYTTAAINRAEELRKANRELIKASRQDQQKIATQVHQLEHQTQVDALSVKLNEIKLERLQLEMGKLNRFDEHILAEDDDKARPGFRPQVRAPQIRSITVLKEERGTTPTRVSGVGFGVYTTKLYEIVFSDGSRQRVESKEFTPQQRR